MSDMREREPVNFDGDGIHPPRYFSDIVPGTRYMLIPGTQGSNTIGNSVTRSNYLFWLNFQKQWILPITGLDWAYGILIDTVEAPNDRDWAVIKSIIDRFSGAYAPELVAHLERTWIAEAWGGWIRCAIEQFVGEVSWPDFERARKYLQLEWERTPSGMTIDLDQILNHLEVPRADITRTT